MNRFLSFILLLTIFFVADLTCEAQSLTRQQKMQQTMNCLSRQMSDPSELSWQDICYTYAPTPVPVRTNWQEHYEVVNQQLDMIESGQLQESAPVTPVTTALPTSMPSSDAPTPMRLDRETTPIDQQLKKPNSWFDIQGEAPPANSVMTIRKHRLEYGHTGYFSHYDEPKVMHQKGTLFGYRIRYTYRPPQGSFLHLRESNMYRLEGEWAKGKFNYRSDDEVIHSKGAKDISYDLRGLIGKDFYPSLSLRATPYTGFGYRYLSDKSEGIDTTVGSITFVGYDRFSHYYYLPVGMEFLYQTDPLYSVESNVEFDWVMHGYQVSKISIVPGYNDITNRQRGGYGLRSGLRLNRYFKHGALFGEIFYRYWNIRQSDSVPDPTDPSFSLLEPKNHTNEVGLRLGVEI